MIKFFRSQLERRGPIFVGLLLAGVMAYGGVCGLRYASSHNWHVEVLYSSLFDLGSIITAFLFAFFTFAKSADSEFMKRLRKTKVFGRFMGYLIIAMLSTAFLTVITIPLMITTPEPIVRWDLVHFLLILWAFVVGFALAATWRSTRQFVVLATQDVQPD